MVASKEASESAGFSDEVPTSTAGEMETLARKVCGLRQEWSRIALNYSERQSIVQNAASLQSVSEDDWRTIRDYLRAKIPEGRPAWQPRSRAKCIETIGDVLNYALEWKRRTAPTVTAVAEVVPIKPRAVIDRSELAEIFGKVGT